MSDVIATIVAIGLSSGFFYLLLTTPAQRQRPRGRSSGDASGADGGSSSESGGGFGLADFGGHSAMDSMGNPIDGAGSDGGGGDGGGGDGGGGD